MNKKSITTFVLLGLSSFSFAQVFSKLQYSVEFGTAISVGANRFKEYQSSINPWTIQYYDRERYRYLSLRFRGTAIKHVSPSIGLGLKSGAEIHYFEYDHEGGTETYFSFPIQAAFVIRSARLNKKWGLLNSVSGGVNFNNWNRAPRYKDAGFIGSLDLSLVQNVQRKSCYYKIGFEYAQEKTEYEFFPPFPSLKYEKVVLNSSRQSAYVSIGYCF